MQPHPLQLGGGERRPACPRRRWRRRAGRGRAPARPGGPASTSPSGSPAPRRRRRGEVGDAARVPDACTATSGRRSRRSPASAASSSASRQRRAERRLGRDHRVPASSPSRARRTAPSAVGAEAGRPAPGRTGCRCALGHLDGGVDARRPVEDLDDVGEVHQPRRQQDLLAPGAGRARPCRPSARRSAHAVADASAEPETFHQRVGGPPVVLEHLVHGRGARRRGSRRRAAPARPAASRRRGGGAANAAALRPAVPRSIPRMSCLTAWSSPNHLACS